MASSKRRASSSCSFLTLLLSFLNFVLFILATASIAPIIAIRSPPTSLGLAFLTISSISILSAFVGFYSQLTHFCYVFHFSLLLTSSASQLLGFLALFTKEKASLLKLNSPRDPREAKFLVRLECGALMAMLVMQLGILILSCIVHSCWVRDYEGMEAERDAMEEKRRQRMAQVHEESMARMAEMKGKELDEKVKNKCGQWEKNNLDDKIQQW